MSEHRPEPQPADSLLHPAALAAIGLLIVNDHLLKGLAPGAITGKLSDFAGLAFFPLLLVGTCGTAIVFSLVKTTPQGADLFAWAIGSVQWLLASTTAWALSLPAPIHHPAVVTIDVTDLMALGALALPSAIGARRVIAGGGSSGVAA